MSNPNKVLLQIDNLHATVADSKILHGISLQINYGEIHAIMGPNGAGKSSLANIIAGIDGYKVTKGDILFMGQSLLQLLPEQRAQLGLFLGFQYPVAIPGVSTYHFLRNICNNMRKQQKLAEIDVLTFMEQLKVNMQLLQIDESFLQRAFNVGFSGGEKKRNEILQLLTLQPKLAILDESDSGLDIDALHVIAKGINTAYSADRAILLITHYQRLLNHVKPGYVHILAQGRIVESGDYKLALALEEHGYAPFTG